MTEDQDNAGEVVAGAVRVALTAAGQMAEQAARRRETDLREAKRDSAARVATLQSQLAAERELALRSVRDVVQRGDTATVEEVVHAWEQARTWDNPTMAIEQARLEDRIRARFGVGASDLAVERGVEQATATALAARDVVLQADDALHRNGGESRVASLQGQFADVAIHHEAAVARALAAESHPTPVSDAARGSQGGSLARPARVRTRYKTTERQVGR